MQQKMQNGACKNMKADEDMIGQLVTGLTNIATQE